jgi:ribosomal protein S18 acetylase RimI-like enzyme
MIRKIEDGDIPAIVALLREFAAYEQLEEYCTATEEMFNTAMFGPGAVVEGLIAFEADAAVGYALFYPSFSSFRGQRGFFLEDIYVTTGHRGKHVGKAMLKEIARIAAERRFDRIDFHVLDWNTSAIGFYHDLGAVSNPDETHFKFADEAFQRLASD